MDTALIALCKAVPTGRVGAGAVLLRTQIEIANPEDDPMTARILPLIESVDFSKYESVLDVGCYGGFLYHYKHPKGYVGLDIWKEAIQAAKRLAPEADFRHESVMEHTGDYDLVWSTQIGAWSNPGLPMPTLYEKLVSLGRHHLIAFIASESAFLPGNSFNHETLRVWSNL